MNNILAAAMPTPGHVNPMLAAACHLRDSGHRVIFNTAEVFRDQIESSGIRFVPLEGFANFDYPRLDDAFPERKKFAPGPDQLIHDFKHGFGQPIRRIRRSKSVAQYGCSSCRCRSDGRQAGCGSACGLERCWT